MQQALLDGLELVDQRLGFADGGVEGIEDLGDLALLLVWRNITSEGLNIHVPQVVDCSSCQSQIKVASVTARLEYISHKPAVC
ncbi:hypothetical protein D3C78_1443100 [compost metagenome]